MVVGDVFLQDLRFHRVEGAVIENVVSEGELVTVRAAFARPTEKGAGAGCAGSGAAAPTVVCMSGSIPWSW